MVPAGNKAKHLSPVNHTTKTIQLNSAKSVATYDFNLYTALPHGKLIKSLWHVIDFVFEGGNRTHILFPKTMLHTGKTSKDNVAFNNVAFSIYFEYIKNFFKTLHKTAILCLAIHSSDRK